MKKFLLIPFIVFQINAVGVQFQNEEDEDTQQEQPLKKNSKSYRKSSKDEPLMSQDPFALLHRDFKEQYLSTKQLFDQDQEGFSEFFESEEKFSVLKDCIEKRKDSRLNGEYVFKNNYGKILEDLRKIHMKNNESKIKYLEQSSIIAWGQDSTELMIGGKGQLKVYPDFKKSDNFMAHRFNDLPSAHCTKLAISNDSLYTLLLLFDPKSKKLALNPKSNTLQLYSQDKCIKEIPDVNDFTWFPNSKEFLLIHLNGSIARHNIRDGKIYTMESGSSFKERRIAMSPDCSRFALFEEFFTRVFESESFKEISQDVSYKHGAIVDAQSGKLAAAAYSKNHLFLYSWANQVFKATNLCEIQDIAWNKEGDLLAVAHGKKVKLFDTELQEKINCPNYVHESDISRVLWSLDDELIAAGSRDVIVWDLEKENERIQYKIFDSEDKERVISQVAISPDGKNLALLSRLRGNDGHDEVVIVPIDDSKFLHDMKTLDPLQVMLVAYLFNNCITGKNNQVNELIKSLPVDVQKAILARTLQNYKKVISGFNCNPEFKYGKMEE